MKHQLFLTIILIFLGLFFFQSIGFSQDNPDPTIYPVTDITPPDPTNAAFDKFLNIPVSLFTGTPEISIPLWKVSQGILNIPITLSYHASGVKIDEISGWVGQGWLLNAGGIINRTIMGLPDESQNSGYFYNKNIVPESPTELYIFDNYRDLSTLYNLSKGTIDAQPDIFSYNIPSHNGNFVMHCTPKSGNPPFSLSPVIYPYENLKIIYYSSYSTSVDFNKWEIIDEKGIKYIFDVSLKSQSEATDCSPRHFNVNTSWYLSKIISPNGKDSITFYYTDYFSNNYSLPAEIKKHKYSTEEEFHCFEDYYYEYCSNETTSIQKRLSKIQYNNCILEFIQSNPFDNQDLCVLNKINIKQLNPDKLLKSFSFSYHLNSDRIILDSLKEICQSDSLPPYKFSYYCLDHLPGTFSSSRDHWGFFNGKNNPGLIPSVYFLNQELPGADRSPDTSKMIYGVLNKIQYPTGGSICFDFEAGDYSHYANGYKVTHYYTQNKEIGLSRPCDNVPYCFQYCPIEIKTDSFYLDHDQQINMYLYATNVRIPNERESSLIILDSTGVNQVAYLNSSSSSLTQYGTFNLITGKYYAKLFANQCDDTHGTVSYSSLNFQNDTLNYNHIEYGGGIRIKRINFSDGQKSFIKRYLYRNADGTSTGYLFGQNPVYEYF
ncbi:MAG: hypothetical protein Q8867_01870 [Bacteroidota bacterium]|nr:hypothetical protein [Bacteroidota bacterium]